MRWGIIVLSLFIAGLVVAEAQGPGQPTTDSLTAATLYTACAHPVKETPEVHEFAEQTCATYMRGLTDGLWMMRVLAEDHQPTCLPANTPIAVGEARRMFEAWLRTHPETATNSAGLVATMAIVKSYNCGGAH
jgi:hypothetical protein